ncbi:MAG: nucleotidyltransferase family protein [Acidimicrobiia bacterium]
MTWSALILAAGAAERMGRAKVVLSVGSQSMVGSVVSSARLAGLDDVVVVTGYHGDVVADEIEGTARIVQNPDASRGNMSSLVTGLDAVPDSDGVVVLLGDMPLVSHEIIRSVRDTLASGGATACWVEYTDADDRPVMGHPVGLAAAAFPAVRRLTGRKALWKYLEGLPDVDVARVEVEEPKPLDVNTADDYEQLTRQLRGSD